MSAEAQAPVAAVVVTWSSAAWIEGCLRSVLALDRPPAEIVVVDSGSTDDTVELARAACPGAEVLACGENVGFCRAANLGIARTTSPFVLLLNADTKLMPHFLEELLQSFEDPSVGVAAGKLLRFDGATLDSAGQELARSRHPRDLGYGEPDRGQLDQDGEVFGACAAAALYRRGMLDAVADPGGAVFDEAFFTFYEDLDLAWRGRKLGWKAAYRHRAVGYHARGAASGSPGPRRGFYLLGRGEDARFHAVKNRYLTILRNDTWAGYLGNLPFVLARDLALGSLLLLGSPRVLARLWRERGLFRRALALRRLDAGRARRKVLPAPTR